MDACRAELISLRGVQADDLPIIFAYQGDEESNRVAVANPRDYETFHEEWTTSLANPSVVGRVILLDGRVVGNIAVFPCEGQDTVGYWINRAHWGRGIASRALALLLCEVTVRPLHAQAAMTNVGSIRVLEKCSFERTGQRMSIASERFPACEEAVFVLR